MVVAAERITIVGSVWRRLGSEVVILEAGLDHIVVSRLAQHMIADDVMIVVDRAGVVIAGDGRGAFFAERMHGADRDGRSEEHVEKRKYGDNEVILHHRHFPDRQPDHERQQGEGHSHDQELRGRQEVDDVPENIHAKRPQVFSAFCRDR